ncbi:cytochrome c [Noviherbaspirillum agri]
MRRIALLLLVALVAVAAVLLAVLLYIGTREDETEAAANPTPATPEQVARGAYLARAGNCVGCHTERGGSPYAGGRAIRTPFGAIHAPNITPDNETGIGSWTADDFWRALHNGKSKDGTLLYPAFPYPNYTKVTRADADAMYAYFRTLTPVRRPNREPELRFPFNQRLLLAGWRALYFRPGTYQAAPARDAEWNRGAYLVQGLGHCNACHTPRNVLGATQEKAEFSGAMMPMLGWHAAALTGEAQTGLGQWTVQDLSALLGTGISPRGAASGPMAEVVRKSLQHLSGEDLRAMAVYLKSLPGSAARSGQAALQPEDDKTLKLGAALYEEHCTDCHKAAGEGVPPHYPALAGNRAVVLETPANAIRALLHGGYPPSTRGNPRPYGMPPFGPTLNDQEAAAVLSYIRNAWGNRAPMVSADQVNRHRTVHVD